MLTYIVRRLLLIIPTLLGVTLVVFLLLELVPADPVIMLLGQQATPEQIAEMREKLHLDDPVWLRYWRWLTGVLQGDFGTSLIDHRPVFPTVVGRLPATLELLATATLLAVALGIPAGVISALHPNSIADSFSRIAALIGLCVPSFWLALLLMLVMSYHLDLLPIGGRGGFLHLILPTITLGTSMAALVMRLTRSAVLEELGADYVRTARSKGLKERVILYRHALRNALLPVVTIVGLNVGYLLGGTVVVETMFEWPGVGSYAYLKMMQRDYPAIMGNLFLFALFFCIVNLVTDISYSFLDPRIRYE